MAHFDVALSISADEFSRLYQGQANSVFAHTRDGRSIRFPARSLIAHLSRSGVRGHFRITVDSSNRLVDVSRLS
ncbi:MAG: DUF2835 domain-containing protein [Pseudomonadaceae bacterium]|nr:DUF2835 domain-containing protein [Pseudomonadaceae bacterium]